MANYRRWGNTAGPGRTIGTGSYYFLGASIPKPLAWLIALTIGATALSAVLERNHVLPLQTYWILTPRSIWAGQVWRLLTWTLLEYSWSGLGLVFGCLALYMIGRDLLGRWTTARFFAVYFGTAAASAGATCVIARLFWPGLMEMPYATMWPAVEGLIIAWAIANPEAMMFVQFVLPVRGRNLIYAIVGTTVIASMIDGLAPYVPHFCAQAFMLIYMDAISLRRLWLRGRLAMLQRSYDRRTSHLRVVERDRDSDEPPRWTH